MSTNFKKRTVFVSRGKFKVRVTGFFPGVKKTPCGSSFRKITVMSKPTKFWWRSIAQGQSINISSLAKLSSTDAFSIKISKNVSKIF